METSQDVIIVVQSLCAFFVVLLFAFTVFDMAADIYSTIKGKHHDWTTHKFFLEFCGNWKAQIIILAAFLIGVYSVFSDFSAYVVSKNNTNSDPGDSVVSEDYGRDEYECWYCSDKVPKEYAYEEEGKAICPRCIYGDYEFLLDEGTGKCVECGNFYIMSESHGADMCAECGDALVTECKMCHKPVRVWKHGVDFAFCSDCMGYALDNSDIETTLRELCE